MRSPTRATRAIARTGGRGIMRAEKVTRAGIPAGSSTSMRSSKQIAVSAARFARPRTLRLSSPCAASKLTRHPPRLSRSDLVRRARRHGRGGRVRLRASRVLTKCIRGLAWTKTARSTHGGAHLLLQERSGRLHLRAALRPVPQAQRPGDGAPCAARTIAMVSRGSDVQP